MSDTVETIINLCNKRRYCITAFGYKASGRIKSIHSSHIYGAVKDRVPDEVYSSGTTVYINFKNKEIIPIIEEYLYK